jgi:hypothetical protein
LAHPVEAYLRAADPSHDDLDSEPVLKIGASKPLRARWMVGKAKPTTDALSALAAAIAARVALSRSSTAG